jgi:hypothetical protein
MSSTVNFTASIDKQLLKRAKVVAAKLDISVNALLNHELRYLVESYEAGELSGNQNYRTLLDFSLGRIDEFTALTTLGFTSPEDLFRLLNQVKLPRPRLDDEETAKMVDELHQLGS